jgi:hypothetical protein
MLVVMYRIQFTYSDNLPVAYTTVHNHIYYSDLYRRLWICSELWILQTIFINFIFVAKYNV